MTSKSAGSGVTSEHKHELYEPQEETVLAREQERGDVLDFLLLLATNKKTIIRATVVFAFAGIVISLLIPTTYRSESRILPPQQAQSVANMMLGQLGPLAALAGKDLGLKNPADLYVAMLKSDSVEDALVERFELQKVYNKKYRSDTKKKLEDRSEIAGLKEGVITISVEDRSPERARDLARGYVEELQKVTERLAVTESGQRRLFYERQLKMAKDNLADAEVRMKQTEEKTGLIHADVQARAIIESVARLRAQIAAKEVQLQAMRSFATQQNPDYVRVQQEVSGLNTELQKLQQTSGAGNGDIQVATKNIPAAGLEYIRAFRDVKYYETIFELIAKQYEIARLDEAKEAPVIQVIDEARVPDKKYSPHRAIIVILITLLGFLGTTAYVLARENVRERNSDPGWAVRMQMLRSHFRRRRT